MKKNNKKLLIFWIIASIFLFSWSYYWLKISKKEASPSLFHKVEEAKSVYDIWSKISQKDDQEKTFLLLFQNDMELRPSGGYIGTFGVLKIKNGEEIELGAHNTNNFDGRVPDGMPVPYPMEQMLRIKHWKMRDANWFPNFPDSALQAEKFYKLGQGEETFDGIIGINSRVLTSFLEITGPIQVSGVEEPFTHENAILKLEYLVEKGYKEIGNSHKDRKQIVSDLARNILEKTKSLSFSQKIELLQMIENDLNQKEIQIFFKDESLQKKIRENGWDGEMNQNWQNDYLMIIDSNLGALKSNRLMEYSLEYFIDLTQEKPIATLKFKQTHTGKEKDWLTKNYQGYLRVYVPREGWLTNLNELPQVKFKEEYNKKSFGIINKIPLGESREYKFVYTLEEKIKNQPYKLLIQKQSGMKDVPVKIILKSANGQIQTKNIILQKDELIEF